MKRNRIVDIEGYVTMLVDDHTYNWYWSSKGTDAYIVACRRILGLGPNDNCINRSYIKYNSWGSVTEESLDKLNKSDLVKRVEHTEPHDNYSIRDIINKFDSINPKDPEFEPDLEL